jgi:hypothetical protein
MYRDPRDVLLSMVDFLVGSEPSQLGAFPDHHVYAAILRSVETVEERLTIALTDPAFPGVDAFVRAQWLLRHPRVCQVSFEELIGVSGGGSAARQSTAVARMASFLGVDADVRTIAGRIFNDKAHTFHRGQIGRWRYHFTSEHCRLFNDRFGQTAWA